MVINQLSPIYVTFSVPGRYLGDIRRYQSQRPLGSKRAASGPAPGAQAPARADAGIRRPTAAARSRTAPVSFIDNAVDATTGTIKLKGTFQNADHASGPDCSCRSRWI